MQVVWISMLTINASSLTNFEVFFELHVDRKAKVEPRKLCQRLSSIRLHCLCWFFEWQVNHVFCHLSSVTCQFLVAQNHLAAKVEPGNFCQHLIACGVNVFLHVMPVYLGQMQWVPRLMAVMMMMRMIMWCHFHCVRVCPANLLRLDPSPLPAFDARHFLWEFHVVSNGELCFKWNWIAMIAAMPPHTQRYVFCLCSNFVSKPAVVFDLRGCNPSFVCCNGGWMGRMLGGWEPRANRWGTSFDVSQPLVVATPQPLSENGWQRHQHLLRGRSWGVFQETKER